MSVAAGGAGAGGKLQEWRQCVQLDIAFFFLILALGTGEPIEPPTEQHTDEPALLRVAVVTLGHLPGARVSF